MINEDSLPTDRPELSDAQIQAAADARHEARVVEQARRQSTRREGIAIVFFDAGDPARRDRDFDTRVARLKQIAERELGLRAA